MAENGHYTVINVTANIERADAKKEIEANHPGRNVVALIPGEHASYAHTFCTGDKPQVRKSGAERYLDPFDTSHITPETMKKSRD